MTIADRSFFDVVVIGAGAAGIAAARRLAEAPDPPSLLVLEAVGRMGGRAHTVPVLALDGAPLDLGCHWLHGATDNAWTRIAENLGFAIDRAAPPWDQQHRHLGFPPEQQEAYDRVAAAFHARLEAAQDGPEDRPSSDFLQPGDPWNGLLDAVSTYVSGAELDRVSLHDGRNYQVGRPDWRVVEGYGTAVATHARDVQRFVSLDTPVTRIDHSGPRLRLETGRGTVEAAAAIVTVATPVIADEDLRFAPALPGKVEAAALLPLGLANKVFLRIDEALAAELPRDGHLIGNPHRAETGAYHLRPFGRPLIEAFYGGRLAERLEAEGEEAAAAFVLDELAALLGDRVRRQVRPVLATAWGRAPLIRGSYSYAKPGGAGARAALAAPVDDRLFFAGEACSPHAFTTAHGAHDSGVVAAEQALAARTRRPR